MPGDLGTDTFLPDRDTHDIVRRRQQPLPSIVYPLV